MNEIIKKIEAEQLKAEVPEFHVGDTVKVYAKVKAPVRHLLSAISPQVLVLIRHGLFILQLLRKSKLFVLVK